MEHKDRIDLRRNPAMARPCPNYQDQEAIFGNMVDALKQEAIRASSSDRNHSRYNRVGVLLMSWEHDDLGVSHEVDALATVFERDYGFEVSQLSIPAENSLYRLNRGILDWTEAYDDDGVLLVLYYAGHGHISDSGRTLVWSNRRYEDDELYRDLRWNGCEDILLQAAADKLFIFDCCYAANAVPTGGRGVSEVICASGFESIAPLPGPHSFTTALISVLQRMARLTRPFSLSAIYSGVLSHLKALDPSQITPDGFRIANAVDYASALPGLRRPEFRRTPVHFVRENRHHQYQTFGIQLFPLPKPQAKGFVVLNEEPGATGANALATHPAFTVKVRPAGHLSKADSDVTRRWLRSIPIPVKDMSVEAALPINNKRRPTYTEANKKASPQEEYVQMPPGFDLNQAAQSLMRIESSNQELMALSMASERVLATTRVMITLTVIFLPLSFISSIFSSNILDQRADDKAEIMILSTLIPLFTGSGCALFAISRVI